MNPAQLTSIDAVEIMRGLAIAAQRRRVIYGPLSDQTDLADHACDSTMGVVSSGDTALWTLNDPPRMLLKCCVPGRCSRKLLDFGLTQAA